MMKVFFVSIYTINISKMLRFLTCSIVPDNKFDLVGTFVRSKLKIINIFQNNRIKSNSKNE